MEKFFSSLVRFVKRMIRGFRFFMLQFVILMLIEIGYALLGNSIDRSTGLVFLSFRFCVFAYTMIFYCYFALLPAKYRFKTAFVPYLLYMLLVYLGIVDERDWNFRIVTIDSYMLLGWLAPLFGLIVLLLESGIRVSLSNYPNALRKIRKGVNLILVLFSLPLFYLFFMSLFKAILS